MDLLIHVGLHKTGTTSAQDHLFQYRQCLLNSGVLYPTTGLFGCQHALIPGSLIPSHLFLDRVDRSLRAKDYISAFHEEVRSANPELVIISSEVFSEIAHLRASCLDLINQLSHGFASSRLLVTLRDPKALALSALKHSTRERIASWIVDPLGSYITAYESIEVLRSFWEGLGFPTNLRSIENASLNLVDHYFGDIVEEYSKAARACLSNTTRSSTSNTGDKLNSDNLNPCIYIILFMAGNTQNAHLFAKKPMFSLISKAIASSDRFEQLPNLITGSHLTGYLEYFRSKAKEEGLVDFRSVPMIDKIKALQAAGVPLEAINKLASIASKINSD